MSRRQTPPPATTPPANADLAAQTASSTRSLTSPLSTADAPPTYIVATFAVRRAIRFSKNALSCGSALDSLSLSSATTRSISALSPLPSRMVVSRGVIVIVPAIPAKSCSL